jgi:hypothetical protein
MLFHNESLLAAASLFTTFAAASFGGAGESN